jgi:small GTP-binding protein domain
MEGYRKQMYKVIVLGDAGVGKTALLNRYVNERFTQFYRSTVGADFMSKDLRYDDRNITLQIWDTAGQERFQSLSGAFYRGSDCCILAFDITNTDSFAHLDDWRDGFLATVSPKDPNKFPFILVGCKSDLAEERVVSLEDAQEWCKNHGNIPYFEVSAKENINVTKAFNDVARLVTEKEKDEEVFTIKAVKLKESTSEKPKTAGCC